MSPTAEERLTRRAEARRRQVRRRRVVAGAAVLGGALVVVGALVLSAGGESPGQAGPARSDHGSAPAGAASAGDAGGKPKRVSKLPPITPLQPGRAEVITRGPTAGRRIALTFDDGFCAACVAALVRALERTGAHATFFPNGQYGTAWDPQAKRIRALVAAGQVTVGNHTFSHADARAESADAFSRDLQRNEEWIEKTFGITGRPWFRPPYGSFDQGTLDTAGRLGYTRVIMWSGTAADSEVRSVAYLLKAVRDWAKPGVIMLMHANYPNTARALPQMLAILRRRGLTPVTISELVRGR